MDESIFWNTTTILSGLLYSVYDTMRVDTFLIFCFYGIIGVLVDADHFIAEMVSMSRPLHIPILIIVWVVLVGYGAYIIRHI